MNDDTTHTPACDRPEPPPWIYVGWQLLVMLPVLVLVPAFAHGRYVALPGTALAVVAGVVCVWAFIQCPRRAVTPKTLTFLIMLPALYIAARCLTSYLAWGVG